MHLVCLYVSSQYGYCLFVCLFVVRTEVGGESDPDGSVEEGVSQPATRDGC